MTGRGGDTVAGAAAAVLPAGALGDAARAALTAALAARPVPLPAASGVGGDGDGTAIAS